MTCPICLETLDPSPHTLACGHTYHHRCLLSAVLSGHSTCPTCRAPCVRKVCDEIDADSGSWDREQQSERAGHRRVQRAILLGLQQVKEGRATSQVEDAVIKYKRLVATRDRLIRSDRRARKAALAHAQALREAMAPVKRAASSTVGALVSVPLYVNRHSQQCNVAKFETDKQRFNIAEAMGMDTSAVAHRWR